MVTFRWPLWGRYREISRLRQVAEILAKNGLGFLAENLEIRGLPRFCGVRQTDEAVVRERSGGGERVGWVALQAGPLGQGF